MTRMPCLSTLLFAALLAPGCACFDRCAADGPDKLMEWAVDKKDKKNGNGDKKKGNGNGDKPGTDEQNEGSRGKEEPKTGNGDKKDNAKNDNGDPKENGKKDTGADNGENGNGADKEDADKEDKEEDEIETDRPDFTNSPTTVGKGRVQIETGYTYYHDRNGTQRLQAHTYPELLLRVGMFADWFEWRFGLSYANQINIELPGGDKLVGNGWQDMYLGCKIALTEQKGCLPEAGVTLQTTVPTGVSEYTAGQLLPGVALLYRWDIIDNCLSLGGSSQINRAIGEPLPGLILQAFAPEEPTDGPHPFVEMAQSLSLGYQLTRKWAAYTEWFAFIPTSATDPGATPEHFFNGGFTYKLRPNFQWDIRAGVGLNENADNLFAGSGLSVRF